MIKTFYTQRGLTIPVPDNSFLFVFILFYFGFGVEKLLGECQPCQNQNPFSCFSNGLCLSLLKQSANLVAHFLNPLLFLFFKISQVFKCIDYLNPRLSLYKQLSEFKLAMSLLSY